MPHIKEGMEGVAVEEEEDEEVEEEEELEEEEEEDEEERLLFFSSSWLRIGAETNISPSVHNHDLSLDIISSVSDGGIKFKTSLARITSNSSS